MDKLTYENLFKANDLEYMKNYPGIAAAIIRDYADYPPDSCLCCVCFKWIFKEDRTIDKSICTANPMLEDLPEEKRHDKCPINKYLESDPE